MLRLCGLGIVTLYCVPAEIKMTLLSKREVIALQIVKRNKTPNVLVTEGFRSSTYDSHIGEIISKSGICQNDTYTLKPRSIVWLVSEERFDLPNNVTGLTTLRTTWTRKGILTLTVGIVDPCYNGPLTTAVINFGKNDFPIQKGDTFFRTAFFSHTPEDGVPRNEEENDYRKSVVADSNHFSESFLTIDSLASELVPKMWGLPRWGLIAGLIAFIIALIGLIMPPVFSVASEIASKNYKIEQLENRIQTLEER